jgi:hypothetical protein
MKKYLMVAALAATLGVVAQPAKANEVIYARAGGTPWAVKALLVAIALGTTSVMVNAIIVSRNQKRELTPQEAHYAILAPFFWIVHPLAVQPLARKKGKR